MSKVTLRSLNRALLARQFLLERKKIKPLAVIERLVGLQAQLPRPPFIGLWTRIDGFKREDLIELIEKGDVVRATMMRATLHLVSRRDYVRVRPVLQPALSSGMSALRGRVNFDVEEMIACGREFFTGVHTFEEFRDHLGERYRDGDLRAMAYAVRLHLPLINAPSDTKWGFSAGAAFVGTDPFTDENALEDVVLRYLEAFGPASPADMQAWSVLRNLRPVFDTMRPTLKVFVDENGKELFDAPKAPRPDPGIDVPVRFLPEFDNIVLSHADRTRIVPAAYRTRMFTVNGQIPASFLVDGFVAGTWKIERKKKEATLVMTPFERVPRRVLEEEGEKLVRFIEDDAQHFGVRWR